jgi:hypothetical protein
MTDINKTIQNFYDFMDEHKDLNFLNKTKTMVKILEDKDQNAKLCSTQMMLSIFFSGLKKMQSCMKKAN